VKILSAVMTDVGDGTEASELSFEVEDTGSLVEVMTLDKNGINVGGGLGVAGDVFLTQNGESISNSTPNIISFISDGGGQFDMDFTSDLILTGDSAVSLSRSIFTCEQHSYANSNSSVSNC